MFMHVMLVSTYDISIISYVTFCQGMSASSDVGVSVSNYISVYACCPVMSVSMCAESSHDSVK